MSDWIADGIAELLACGDAEVVGKKATGEVLYRLTEQGKRRAAEMIEQNPEARAFMARVVASQAIENARKPSRPKRGGRRK